MKKSLLSGLSCLTIMTAVPATALENFEEDIVVTGTRLGEDARIADGVLTSIDRVEIERIQPATALDILRRLPGVDVVQAGGPGGSIEISLRGGDPNFTMVLLDGVKVNDPTNSRGGGFDFTSLDPDMIERIEVLQGGVSAIYGSDALAGVINIVTRAPEAELEQQISAMYGSRGWWGGNYRLAGKRSEAFSFSLQAGVSDTDEQTEGSSSERKSVSARVFGRIGETTDWQLATFWSDTENTSFPDASGGPELAVLRDLATRDSQQINIAGFVNSRVSETVSLRLEASHMDREEDAMSPAVAPGLGFGIPTTVDDTNYQRQELVASATWQVSDQAAVVCGLSWQGEDGNNEGLVDFVFFQAPTGFELERNTWSGFAEASFAASGGLISAGVRHDDTDGISATTFRLGGSVNIAGEGTRLSGHFGEGFKLPSFSALGHALVGNPDLLPETSRNVDINLTHTGMQGRLTARATWFHNKYRNLIDFDAEAFLNVNRSRVRSTGFELAASYRITDQLSVNANITHTDADILDSDDILRNRPKWKGNAGLSWSDGDTWGVGANLMLSGRYNDFAEPTGLVWLSGYERLDISGWYMVGEGAKLSLALDNALNSSYQQFIGFDAPARTVRARLSWGF